MDRPSRPSRYPRLCLRSQTLKRQNNVRIREIRQRNTQQSDDGWKDARQTPTPIRAVRESDPVRDAAVYGADG